jgi:CheY-like chemotaxis protein
MRKKLLLIEDDAGIAALLPAVLRPLGFEVLHAADCRKAAEIAAAHAEEILVTFCDVLLPDGPGAGAARIVRQHCPGMRTIFTSGYPMDVLSERGLLSRDTLFEFQAGYLPKPFLPRDVRGMIELALETNGAPATIFAIGGADSQRSYAGRAY